MEITNQARVGTALDLLSAGLRPFVVDHLQAAYGDRAAQEVRSALRSFASTDPAEWDVQTMLDLLWYRWDAVFAPVFGKRRRTTRNLVAEIGDWRNQWAHQSPLSDDDMDSALDSIRRLLTAIGAT